jgi:hypothetical protein
MTGSLDAFALKSNFAEEIQQLKTSILIRIALSWTRFRTAASMPALYSFRSGLH